MPPTTAHLLRRLVRIGLVAAFGPIAATAVLAPPAAQAVPAADPSLTSMDSSGPVVELDGAAYFFAHLESGWALLRSDGTNRGTAVVSVPRPGRALVVPQLIVHDNQLFFTLESEEEVRSELWQSDGTRRGTRQVGTGAARSGWWLSSSPSGLLVSGFDATLRRFDAAGRRLRTVASWPGHEGASHLGSVGGRALVLAWRPGASQETALYAVADDGQQVKLATGLRTFDRSYVRDGHLYFLRDDGVHGVEPWVTDGTPAGTRLVAELAPTSPDLPAIQLTATKGAVYIATPTGTGSPMAVHRLTPSGAARLSTPEPAPAGTAVLEATDDDLYLTTREPGSFEPRSTLWRAAKGEDRFVPAGVTLSGPPLVGPRGLLVRTAAVDSRELRWLSDGQLSEVIAQPYLAIDREGFYGSLVDGVSGQGAATAAGLTWFTASPIGEERRLWRTDGTAAGTWPIIPEPKRAVLSISGSRDLNSAIVPVVLHGTLTRRGGTAATCRGTVNVTVRRKGKPVTSVDAPLAWAAYSCRWSADVDGATFTRRGPYTARATLGKGRNRMTSAAWSARK